MYGWGALSYQRTALPISTDPILGRALIDSVDPASLDRTGGIPDLTFRPGGLFDEGVPIQTVPTPPTPLPPSAPQATAPVQSTVYYSSAVPASTPPASSPSFFDSIPWWGWLAGAGAALYVMKGKR